MNINVGTIIDDLKCIEIDPKNSSYFKLQCQVCHREKWVKRYELEHHCGTTHKACSHQLHFNYKNEPFYERWVAMRNRTNPNIKNKGNKCYRTHNIKSDAFKYFIDFYDSMYESFIKHAEIYGEDNTSLDRIDSTKDYTPENCRWITKSEQGMHTSRVKDYIIISPERTVYTGNNIRKFFRENNMKFTKSIEKAARRASHTTKLFPGWKFMYKDNSNITTIPDECKGVNME